MIYDISPLLDADVAVWPGDSKFEARDLLRLEDGSSVHLSSISLSCHTGAHADAPCHYVQGGASIDAAPLEKYLGPCLVVDVTLPDGRLDVTPDLLGHVDRAALRAHPRVLLRTGCMTDRTVFPEQVTHLTPELVDALADEGVVLIGIDSPSVDDFSSKDLPSHHALARRGVVNLECLALSGVPGRGVRTHRPAAQAGRARRQPGSGDPASAFLDIALQKGRIFGRWRPENQNGPDSTAPCRSNVKVCHSRGRQ